MHNNYYLYIILLIIIEVVMEKKFKEELQKRVSEYLPKVRSSNVPAPNLKDIQSSNNLKNISDETLKKMFDLDHENILFNLEGAMDQLDDIMLEMTDMAEVEMLHDYPEIANIMQSLHDYKRSPKTSETVKKLYNLTRYLNLPLRTFEIETPLEENKKICMKKLENSFEVFLKLEENLYNKKLENEQKSELKDDYSPPELTLGNEDDIALKEENKKKKELKDHPFYIPNAPKFTPFS